MGEDSGWAVFLPVWCEAHLNENLHGKGVLFKNHLRLVTLGKRLRVAEREVGRGMG